METFFEEPASAEFPMANHGIEIQPSRASKAASLKWWISIKLLLGSYYHLQITVWQNPRISVFLWVAHFPCLAINSIMCNPVGQVLKGRCGTKSAREAFELRWISVWQSWAVRRKDIILGSDCHWRLNIDRSNVVMEVWSVKACASR